MVRHHALVKKEVSETEIAGKENTCHHYWVIEAPEGPTSRGVCKFCGEVKEFYNSWLGLGSAWTRSSSSHVKRSVAEPGIEPEPEDVEPEEEEKEPPAEELDTLNTIEDEDETT